MRRLGFEIQEVMDDVGVFGSVETMEDYGSGIRTARGLPIDFRFQPVPESLVVGQRRPAHTRRGHHAGAKFSNDSFPQLRVVTCGREI